MAHFSVGPFLLLDDLCLNVVDPDDELTGLYPTLFWSRHESTLYRHGLRRGPKAEV